MTFGVAAEIGINHIPNINRKLYRLSQLDHSLFSDTNYFRNISRNAHVEKRNACKVLVGKSEGK
jgi:hypothetical protein